MPEAVAIAFLGDVVGQPGKRALTQLLPKLRQSHAPDLVLANAENVRNGSGISPDLYSGLRGLGIDCITLGDHAFRDARIVKFLEDPNQPILRPANISARAPGKRLVRLKPPAGRRREVVVLTVLGRIFFPSMPADDPFAAVDEILASIPAGSASVIVEAHMEATSEKIALAHHLDGRVAAVVGSHTHVPTADARILKGGTAFVTDLGMCGPYDSVIGRDKRAVLAHMTTQVPTQFDVGSGDERMCGVVVRVSDDTGLAVSIERVDAIADPNAAPFVSLR